MRISLKTLSGLGRQVLVLLGTLFVLTGLAATEIRADGLLGLGRYKDNPAQLEARIESGATTATGVVELDSEGEDIEGRKVSADNFVLRTEDGKLEIQRSSMSIAGGGTFGRGEQFKTLTVTVNNVKLPGVYTGRLTVKLAPKPAADPSLPPDTETIDVTLRAYMKPTVTLPTGPITTNLVACDNWVTCAIAQWLVPGSNRRKIVLHATNGSPGPVEIQKLDSTLKHKTIEGQAVRTKIAPTPIELDGESSVKVSIGADTLVPGEYIGTLRIKSAHSNEPRQQIDIGGGRTFFADFAEHTISTTVNVRMGPVWALGLILLGIIGGRVANVLQGTRTKEQLALFDSLEKVKLEADGITDVICRGLVALQIARLRDEINTMVKKKPALEAEVNLLAALIKNLLRVETYEKMISDLNADDGVKAPLREKAESIRKAWLEKDATEAEKLILALEEDLVRANSGGTRVVAEGAEGTEFEESALAVANFKHYERIVKATDSKGVLGFIGNTVAALSGDKVRTSVETKYWIWRPLFFLILLLALTLLGLQFNYGGDDNATVGAGGIADYMTLFLWGFGSQVVNATLQSLPTRSN